MLDYSYAYLVSCSVHIGHSLRNSTNFCAWMVLAVRQNILLINLYKFTYMMRLGLELFKNIVRRKSPIWFVSLDPGVTAIVKAAARNCGEFHVTCGWIPGILSNFPLIRESYAVFNRFSPLVHSARYKSMRDIYVNWSMTRNSWPRAIFLCGVKHSYIVAKEALSCAIPCVGIVDTDTYGHCVPLAIPGNDESTQSLIFYNNLIAQLLLREKFNFLFAWFASTRKPQRLTSFIAWFSSLTLRGGSPLAQVQPLFVNSYFIKSRSFFQEGLRVFFSRPLNYARAKESIGLLPLKWGKVFSSTSLKDFFTKRRILFMGIVKLRFLVILSYGIFKDRHRHALALQRDQHQTAFFAGASSYRNHWIDLFGPRASYPYYRSSRAMPYLRKKNHPMHRLCLRIFSATLLVSAYYMKKGGSRFSSFLNPLQYRSRFRHSIRKRRLYVRSFFRNIVYTFLAGFCGFTRQFLVGLKSRTTFARKTRKTQRKIFYFSRRLRSNLPSKLAAAKEVKAAGTIFRRSRRVDVKSFFHFNVGYWSFKSKPPRCFWEASLGYQSKAKETKLLPAPTRFDFATRQSEMPRGRLFRSSISWFKLVFK